MHGSQTSTIHTTREFVRNARISRPISSLQNQELHLNRLPRFFACTLELKKHYLRRQKFKLRKLWERRYTVIFTYGIWGTFLWMRIRKSKKNLWTVRTAQRCKRFQGEERDSKAKEMSPPAEGFKHRQLSLENIRLLLYNKLQYDTNIFLGA